MDSQVPQAGRSRQSRSKSDQVTQIPFFRAATLMGCLAMLANPAAAASQPRLIGAGAIFPFPLYATWFKQFSRDPTIRDAYNSTGVRVEYGADGSDAGVHALIAGSVDFAASDRSIDDAEAEEIERGVVALPMTAGSVALAYNLPSVDALRLPRSVYPAIFAGRITRWNDPAIAAANPDIALPETAITVVVRADAARATDVLTAHLSAVDAAFRRDIGRSSAPEWPADAGFVSAPMNDGVAAEILRTPGAIGYLDYGYAKLADWQQLALLENKAGRFTAPGPASGAAALAAVPFPAATLPSGAPDLRAQDRDPAAENAYPITAMTWLLFYASGYGQEQLNAVRDLINYCVSNDAQDQAPALGYVPLPDAILDRVREAAGVIQ
jgi:phosphate transport system substrate-binding protein